MKPTNSFFTTSLSTKLVGILSVYESNLFVDGLMVFIPPYRDDLLFLVYIVD